MHSQKQNRTSQVTQIHIPHGRKALNPFLPGLLARQHRQGPRRGQHDVALVLDLEQASPYRHWDAHDDGLTHTSDVIHPSVQGCVKQVVRGLLKGGKHQNAVLHLGDTKPGDTQHLPLDAKASVIACLYPFYTCCKLSQVASRRTDVTCGRACS